MSWRLKKKYHDLLAGESGYWKKVWGDQLTICLAYPNVYRTGMSNLGYQTIYRLLNEDPDIVCERVFLPDPGDEVFFSSGSLPLFSIESQRPLRDFDIVAFSLSFENDYPHILTLLEMGGIDPVAANRDMQDPLVVAGGIAVTMNPEPVADFFDFFLLGEAEEVLPECLRVLSEHRKQGRNREACLHALQASVPGVYVPSCYDVRYAKDGPIESFRPRHSEFPQKIIKRWVGNLNAFTTDQAIIAPDMALGNMFLTEVSRGCGRGCRFCAAGYLYRPPRFRRAGMLEASLLKGLEKVNRIGLLGTAVSDHPDLVRICRTILDRGGQVAVGSLRLDQLKGELIGILKEGGIETFSIAPEAGSQRLRDLIRKDIREEQIIEMAHALLEQGIINIRTYFMIGLPTETDDDIQALIDLVEKLSRITVKEGNHETRFRRVTISINQFIPKAATPLQWYPLDRIENARNKIRRIKASFQKQTSLRLQAESPRANYLQSLFSLGDRRVGQMLLACHRQGRNWSRTFKEAPLHPDFWVYRPKPLQEILPWDFIDHGVRKSHLVEEYQKTLEDAP